MAALEDKLKGWTGPSSDTEQEKQERTVRMIREAVENHSAFKGYSLKVYAKGSYANYTNVRSDSDVDIAVQCTNLFYWKEETPGAKVPGESYKGPWTSSALRSELKAALEAKFSGQVDSSGSTAFRINSSSARVEADVVPCCDFRYYFNSGTYREGSKVFKTDGSSLINYPEQQRINGIAKNKRSNLRYKQAVRIMKRLENAMVDDGAHREVPSYFVECLVYNVPDSVLTRSTWTDTVKGIISHVFHELDGPEPDQESARWLEVNQCKFLFAPGQKWSREDARAFVKAGWNYLGFKS